MSGHLVQHGRWSWRPDQLFLLGTLLSVAQVLLGDQELVAGQSHLIGTVF